MKRLGQHFLRNRAAIKKIVAALELKPKDVVIEIGPGHGELTEELKMENGKLKIVAIEKDEKLCAELRKKFGDDKNTEIINGDALKLIPDIIHNSLFKIHNYKLVGNIPYYISGHLFRTIGNLKNKPSVCVLTVQEEVAERLSAEPPRMNRLAAAVQFWAKPEIVGRLGENDFRPMPKVKSAVIKLKMENGKWKINAAEYYKTVRMLFAQPRKTILNNLKKSGLPKERLIEELRKIGINPDARPQNLDVESITKISQIL